MAQPSERGGVVMPSPLQDYHGARWWKFDFHTHTPASADYGKGPNQELLRQISPDDWLLAYMRAEVDCVAVTDHNSGDWIERLIAALASLEADKHPDFRPLRLFPGVEITANGGVHILAILDCSKNAADVAQLLGAVKFYGTRGASDSAANASVIEVVEGIVHAGGIAIPAHVDGPAGAFELVKGNTLQPLIDSPHLFAIEVCDSSKPKPEIYRQRKLDWAEVLGSDSHHAAGAAELEQVAERLVLTPVDFRRHARRVALQPDLLHAPFSRLGWILGAWGRRLHQGIR